MDAVTHLLDTHSVIWAYDDSYQVRGRSGLMVEIPRPFRVSQIRGFAIMMR